MNISPAESEIKYIRDALTQFNNEESRSGWAYTSEHCGILALFMDYISDGIIDNSVRIL